MKFRNLVVAVAGTLFLSLASFAQITAIELAESPFSIRQKFRNAPVWPHKTDEPSASAPDIVPMIQ